MNEKNYFPNSISASVLKTIAIISMLIDHFFVIVYPECLNKLGLMPPSYDLSDDLLYVTGRSIGRISFVLFAFMITQGMIHTSNEPRYLLRLLLMAIISEPIYDIAFNHPMGFSLGLPMQNTFFTLFLGALCIYIIKRYADRKVLLVVYITSIFVLSLILGSDYNLSGVLVILFLYCFANRFNLQAFSCLFTLTIIYFVNRIIYIQLFLPNYDLAKVNLLNMFFDTITPEITSLLAFIPIYYYNGSKGYQLPKWFYYFVYPVHLLLLWAIKNLLGS